MRLRKLYLVIGGLLVFATVLIVAGVILQHAGGGLDTAPQSLVTIHARDMQFDLSTITAKAGQPITIVFENDDDMNHAFAIDALNVYTDIVPPTKSASVTFTPQQAGTYEFRCPILGHDKLGMVGTFVVIP